MLKESTGSTQNESSSSGTSDVLERIENHLSAAPIVLFMTGAATAVAADNRETIVARPRVRFIIYAVAPLMYK
jgi:hypothetical protein